MAAQDPGYADGKAQGHWTRLVSTAWARGGECLAEECGWLALGWRRRALRGLLLSYRHNEHSGPRVTDGPETFLGERRGDPGCPTPAPLAPRTPETARAELGTQWEGGGPGLPRLRLPQPPGRPPPLGLCLRRPGFLDGPSRSKHRALTGLRAGLRGLSRTLSSAPTRPQPGGLAPHLATAGSANGHAWQGPRPPVAGPGIQRAAFVWDKTRGHVGSLPALLPPSVERLLRSSGPAATSWRLGQGLAAPAPPTVPELLVQPSPHPHSSASTWAAETPVSPRGPQRWVSRTPPSLPSPSRWCPGSA